MTSRDFCYWLQGFFELHGGAEKPVLDAKQTELVQRHLALVFKHEIDPSFGGPETQAALNQIHNPLDHAGGGKPGPVMRC